MKKAVWFTFLAAIAISCLDNPDCFRLNNDVFGINFRVMGFGADDKILKDVVIDGANITVTSSIPSSVGLPLNPNATALKYIFNWTDSTQDTLVMGYSTQIQFVSDDCGDRHVFDGLTVLEHTFDSLSVYSVTPTNPSSVNIQIFRCTDPHLFGLRFKQRTGTLPVSITNTKDSAVALLSITPDFGKPMTFDTTQTIVYLPLDTAKSEAHYEFNFANDITRTLDLTYVLSKRLWAEKACGSTFLFSAIKITEATSTLILNDPKQYNFLKQSTSDPAIENLQVILN